MRLRLVFSVALTILVMSAAPAGAGKPTRGPSLSPPGDLVGVCDFVVHAEFPVNGQSAIVFSDADGNPTKVIVTGPLVVELTNVDTSASITRNISGPAVITFAADGSSTLTATGAWALFFFADQLGTGAPSSFIYTHGRTVLRTDADGFHQTILSQVGAREDLCATLADA